MALASSKKFLDIQEDYKTIRCGFTLKLLRDMIITYSQGLFFVFKESSKSLENEIFEASNYILYQLLKFIQIRV